MKDILDKAAGFIATKDGKALADVQRGLLGTSAEFWSTLLDTDVDEGMANWLTWCTEVDMHRGHRITGRQELDRASTAYAAGVSPEDYAVVRH